MRINQNQVASGSSGKTIKIWNIDTNSLVKTFFGHTNDISGLVVMPNGNLASGSIDGTVRVWDTKNNAVQLITTGYVSSLVWNPVIERLVVNTYGIGLIDPISLALTSLSTGGRSYYDADVLLPSGNLIMAGAFLDVYILPSGTQSYSFNTAGILYKVKQLPDNTTAVCGFQSTGDILLFNTNTNTWASQTYSGGSNSVVMIAVTPDQLYVITAAWQQTIKVWTWSTMSLTLVNAFTSPTKINTAAIIASVYQGGSYFHKIFKIILKIQFFIINIFNKNFLFQRSHLSLMSITHFPCPQIL
jgi:WD40 repeat protein